MTDPKIKDAAFIAAANAMLRPHLDTDGFEIDPDDGTVSRNKNRGLNSGAFVKVWVWVDNETAKKEQS